MKTLASFDGEVAEIWRKANPPIFDGERVVPGSAQDGLAGQVAKHVENQGAVSSSVAGVLVVNPMRSHDLNLDVTESREPFR